VDMPVMLRGIIREYLVGQPDVEIVGEMGEDVGLLEAVDEREVDLVIAGADCLPDNWRRLLAARPAVRLVALAGNGSQAAVCELLRDPALEGLLRVVRRAEP
jgi:DNA-binding NarL/FixJ family response regulator